MFTIAGGKKKKKVPERKVPSVFGGDEEGSNENNEVEGKDKGGPMDWRMEMQRYKRKRVDEEQLQKAMEQDPSFAEYDEVYDSMVCKGLREREKKKERKEREKKREKRGKREREREKRKNGERKRKEERKRKSDQEKEKEGGSFRERAVQRERTI